MTAFRQQYSTYCGEVFGDQCHDIEWDRPRDAWWGDTWFLFRKGLLGKEVYINHKSPAGFVDLTFPNTDATRLKTIAAIPAAGMTIHQTYKSAAIRLNVPKIGQFSDFNQERGKVAEGLVAVRKLLDFYARERDRLQNALINEH